jgi:hypothetical protein
MKSVRTILFLFTHQITLQYGVAGEPMTPALPSARPYHPSLDTIRPRANNRTGSSTTLDCRGGTDDSTDLSRQVSELRATVLAQGELIRRLLNKFEGENA